MRCPSCGRDNPEDAAFCGKCGSSLRREIACDHCGRSNPPGTDFCHGCGTRLAEAAAPPAPIPTPAPSTALPTSFAAGRYQVLRFLGEGGRKRVYLAHDSRLDRDVAIAVVKTEGLDEAGLVRIRREAQAMGRLGDHPHIVTVHDIGEEDGQPYIVSQYMAGGDLDGLLQQAENRRLPIDRAVGIANEVRQALEHAHSRGIVHRDIKPGNIWLTEDGTAKLGDFGLAMALERSRLTVEGMMVGTVVYMPPEQALGREADARSDLYAWGCVLYEMVTGRPPFLGDDAVAIISQHMNTAPVAPSWHNPEVPRALESLILRCLAKDPNERPESAAAMPRAMQAIMATASTVAERVVQDEANPLDRLAGGVFVGREKEMDDLRAGLEDALSGRGRLLMLVGEPGIGKTRTAEELATYASLRKTQVLWGRCYEEEGAPAYWPWVQIIRSYVHDREPQALMSEMGPGAADIAQVVSEVKERLPGLPEPPALEPEQARFRLFDSITTFLKNASNRQPIVLVLDDLHWADKPSLLLLQFLARELRGARLMVLGTYRDVELRREHPLADTLGDLARQGLDQRVFLRGLTERDVARFIEITAAISPPESLVAAVHRETEGNPFFVNEIVRLLVADGRLERLEEVKSWSVTIPQGVRDVVGRRLGHLSAECNRVLTTASVIGREFGLDALEKVSEVKGDRLLEALEEAVGARVLKEVPRKVGRYTFSHALIRETLREDLSTSRRLNLHRQIGEVLEELYSAHPEPHLAELAYHFCETAPTGDVDKAIDYATRAGERALALLAYEDAVSHYEMALRVLELKEPDEPLRCELMLALGDAQNRAGDRAGADETFQAAANIARKLGSPEWLARAAVGYGGRVLVPSLRDEKTQIRLLEDALGALESSDSDLRARVLGRLAQSLLVAGSRERRASLSDEAVEMARRMGDPSTLAYALYSRHWALWESADIEERLAIATEIVRLAEEAGDGEVAIVGRCWRFIDLLEGGEVAAADVEIEALARQAEDLRLPRYQWWTAFVRAMRSAIAGRFEEAERLTQEALATGQRAHQAEAVEAFGIQMYALRREQGRLHELEALVRGNVEKSAAARPWRATLAYLYSESGREAEARIEFEQLAANDFADIPLTLFWLTSLALLSETCAFLKDANRAALLYRLLLPYGGRNVLLAAPPLVCVGSASRHLGLLAATMSSWEEAEGHFEDALEMHAKMGAKPFVARTQQEYAGMLLARSEPRDREKALELVGQALDTAQGLGMKSLAEKALALKMQAQGIPSSEVLRSSIDAVVSSVQAEQPDLRQHAAPDGTVTILFTDIEGSTEMTERLGDMRWLELLRVHNAIVREQVASLDGFEVKAEGDGFMLAFRSARRALQCAIGIQRAFAQHNQSAEEVLHVRTGLHTGEAIKEADDFYGRHVILASRIASAAQGGQILVSSLLKELTESAGDIEFGQGHELELEGLKGKHLVFEVEWRPAVPIYPAGLTAREVEVLRLIAVGKSNREIADELVISLNTVARHVSNIFAKTGVANRAEAATYAVRHRLLSS